MTQYIFANNASSTLSAPITSIATTLTVAVGTGAVFPNPTSGQAFTLTLTDAATGKITEIMLCTSRATDTLTVVRGQEGTTAVPWTTGDFANNFLTAGTAALFIQGTGTLGTMSAQDADAVAITGGTIDGVEVSSGNVTLTGGKISGVELASTVGSTASRPNPPPFVGCQYLDTTLGQPIWCTQVSSPIWINAAGVAV